MKRKYEKFEEDNSMYECTVWGCKWQGKEDEKKTKEALFKIERMENKQEKHKWYNEIISFAEGEVIEVKHKEGDTWTTAITPQFNDERYVFRVKPEPKYIPFTFEDREVFRGKWVRRKKDNAEFIIHIISRNYVNGYSYEEAYIELEFIDGTPFGKLEGGVK